MSNYEFNIKKKKDLKAKEKKRRAWSATISINIMDGHLLSMEAFHLKHHYIPDGIKVKINSNGCVSGHKKEKYSIFMDCTYSVFVLVVIIRNTRKEMFVCLQSRQLLSRNPFIYMEDHIDYRIHTLDI